MTETDEEEPEGTAEIRPDWYMPVGVILWTAGNLFNAIGAGFLSASNLMQGYSNHRDGRIEFHEAAALEIETITTKGIPEEG